MVQLQSIQFWALFALIPASATLPLAKLRTRSAACKQAELLLHPVFAPFAKFLSLLFNLEEIIEGLILIQHFLVVLSVASKVQDWRVYPVNIVDVVYLRFVNEF